MENHEEVRAGVLRQVGVGQWSITVIAVVAAGLLLWGAQYIPRPIFDPVGSAAVPRAIAVALVFLAALNIIFALRQPNPPAESVDAREIRFGLAFFLLMAAYLAAMSLGLGYVVSTMAFILIAVPLIGRDLRLLLPALLAALALGPGLYWLLTSVLYVDLPRFL